MMYLKQFIGLSPIFSTVTLATMKIIQYYRLVKVHYEIQLLPITAMSHPVVCFVSILLECALMNSYQQQIDEKMN